MRQVEATLRNDWSRLKLNNKLRFQLSLLISRCESMHPGSPEDWRKFLEEVQDWPVVLDTPGQTTKRFTNEDQVSMDSLADAIEARSQRLIRAPEGGTGQPDGAASTLRQATRDNGIELVDRMTMSLIGASRSAIVDRYTRALEDCVRAGTAVLRFQVETGRFPDRLGEAMRQPPADPFTSALLQYRREPGRFVIYSVGEDGTFDGGQPGMDLDRPVAYFRYP